MIIISSRIKGIFYIHKLSTADPGGCAVRSMGVRLLACWDCGFENRAGSYRSVCCAFVHVAR